jgi:hypothetical protein
MMDWTGPDLKTRVSNIIRIETMEPESGGSGGVTPGTCGASIGNNRPHPYSTRPLAGMTCIDGKCWGITVGDLKTRQACTNLIRIREWKRGNSLDPRRADNNIVYDTMPQSETRAYDMHVT